MRPFLALLVLVLIGCAPSESGVEQAATPCSSPLQCNDNNLCTVDLCEQNTCVNTPIANCCLTSSNCNDDDVCTTDACDQLTHQCTHSQQGGCCTSDATCVDGQVCTADHCDLRTNTCRHEPIFDCCTNSSMCSDASSCTADNCNTAINRCIHSPIPDCCTTDQDCHDNDSCTVDKCDTATGKCSNTANPTCCKLAGDCADTDTCTADSCTQSSHTCVHDVQPGCCEQDSDCNDGKQCTADICDLSTHACVNSPITGCCTANSQCADLSDCTADSCNFATHQCQHVGIPNCCATNAMCNDGNACTVDVCNPQNGVCSNTDVQNCCLTIGDCVDANPCTSDACDLTTHQCDNAPVEACCLTDIQCEDSNECTQDQCVLGTHSCEHQIVTNCCKLDSDCTDGDPCTTDACTSNHCTHDAQPGCGGGSGGGGLDLGGGGCACDSTGGSPAALVFAIVVGLFMVRRRRTAALGLVLLFARGARADDGFDAQLYQQSTSSSGYLSQESPLAIEHHELDVATTLDFARDPLVARDASTGNTLMNGDVVANRFGMHLTAGYGIARHLELGAALPVVLAQNGDPQTLSATRQLSTTTLGDLRAFAKYQFAEQEALAAAVALDVTLPTGSTESFTGSSTPSVRPRLVVGLHSDTVSAAFNLGYRVVGRSQVANVVSDDELTFGLGAAYTVRPSLWLVGEAFLSVGLFGKDHAVPAEALLGARARFASRWQGQIAVGEGLGRGFGTPAVETIASIACLFGLAQKPLPPVEKPQPPPPPPPEDPDPDHDGIPNGPDQCRNDPEDVDGFQDDDGCPDPDNDNDGILDAADKCPLEPEDRDQFQDDDGCPDPDNDGDGILDPKDACPNEPEVRNGFQDDDGCPDELPDTLTQFVGVVEGVNFKAGSADLLPGATKKLDKAVAVLQQFPDLRLEIQGHTDDQALGRTSKFKDNDELSQARADAVRSYLSVMGIDASRLVAHGYGSMKPIEEPQGLTGLKLRAARAKNRRVEFQIIVPPPITAP